MEGNKVFDTGSRFLDLVRQQIPKGFGIELGTVITPPPNLEIRIDNMGINLEKADLLVCEHILRHDRVATIDHLELTERDLGDGIGIDHTNTDDLDPELALTFFTYYNVKFTLEDTLKKGDRVVVMALPGAQQYLIWDRVVIP